MKRILKMLFSIMGVLFAFSMSVNAHNMNMYVNDICVVRDVQMIDGFDMLPVMDIAGELGYNCSYDSKTLVLYNDSERFTFTLGSASVYDESGRWYGLDVVPQVIQGKIRIPAKFFCDVKSMSYVWDPITNTIFMGSENSYNWLINTEEYKCSNPKYMADKYFKYVSRAGAIYNHNGLAYYDERNTTKFSYDELWYYIADINYDGVLDLIVSPEDYYGNGLMVFTYLEGEISLLVDTGMPYSAGVTRMTIAEYNGKYGVFCHRMNSADEFGFHYVDYEGNAYGSIYGHHFDESGEWNINGRNVGRKNWYDIFDNINPIPMYNVWELKSIAK